jgi:hypothetical protein
MGCQTVTSASEILNPIGRLRYIWNVGLAQLLLLLFSPMLVLVGAIALTARLTGGTGHVTPQCVVDLTLSAYLVLSMAAIVFVSASGATRMRTLFEAAPLKAGSWFQMLVLVATAVCAILLIAIATEAVRSVLQKIGDHAGPETARTWSYGLTRLLLAVWVLALGYRFKLIWDALTTHLDEFETVRWKFGIKPQTLAARRNRLSHKVLAMVATERARRGLEPRGDELEGVTEDEVIESALKIAASMPTAPTPPKSPSKPRTRPPQSLPTADASPPEPASSPATTSSDEIAPSAEMPPAARAERPPARRQPKTPRAPK